MKQLTAALLLVLVIAPIVGAASRAQTLYDQALIKETGERDPEAALKLYQQVVDLVEADQPLLPKARLHMGNCWERLGNIPEAKQAYLQVVKDASASPDTVQIAQAHIERLEDQEIKAREEAEKSKSMVLVKVFYDTRFRFTAGPGFSLSGGDTLADLSLGLRYRLSSLKRPLALYGEFAGLVPVSGSTIGTDANASLKLKYQSHLALVAELPHKTAKTIPEIGIGAALTSSKIESPDGSDSEGVWSPYFTGGVRFFADKRISLLINASYTANPYFKTLRVGSQTQTYNFPDALWTIGASIYVKIGTTKTEMRPKE